jgi:hypothetical protein
MSFTTPVSISFVVLILFIQQFPPPPVPAMNGDIYSFMVLERKNGTPITGGANGDLAVDRDWEFGRWISMIIGTPGQAFKEKVRGWQGYEDVINGIQRNIIVPTKDQEWDYITQYAADNNKNLLQICDLCYDKSGSSGGQSNYIPPACQVFPTPIYLNFILIFSGFVMVLFYAKHGEKTS